MGRFIDTVGVLCGRRDDSLCRLMMEEVINLNMKTRANKT